MRRTGLVSIVAALLLAAPAHGAEWLAGDGHVHTCHSHDAWCPPGDDNTGPDTFYSSGGTVAQRFAEARLKGLNFLVVSDHESSAAWSDPAFGAHGVVGVRAYEHSLPGGAGHANVLGPRATHSGLDAATLVEQVHAEGGLVQANHPAYKSDTPVTSCEQVAAGGPGLHWRSGFAVRPDAVEVWNPTSPTAGAELVWECWLTQGWRLPATGGSDSHGATQPTLGMPTLWVLAGERTHEGVLEAIRAGRTAVSAVPPALGGRPVALEADADRDGTFEATAGEGVPPGTPMRLRSFGGAATGTAHVRANGAEIASGLLPPGGTLPFTAPASGPAWVRATVDHVALASPMYVEAG